MSNDQEVVLDEEKLKRMEFKIFVLERNNMVNNEKTNSQMIESIKRIIEEEAKKCY